MDVLFQTNLTIDSQLSGIAEEICNQVLIPDVFYIIPTINVKDQNVGNKRCT